MKKLFNLALETNIGKTLNITTPKQLYDWMEKNLHYHGASKKYLYSPEEILNLKRAHCWEACSLEYKYLKELGLKPTIVYLENENCIVTHTAVYYTVMKTDQYFWFEWAWGVNRGIHSYTDRIKLLSDIHDKFIKSNKTLTVFKEGHTIIKHNTLQIDYHNTMINNWKNVII